MIYFFTIIIMNKNESLNHGEKENSISCNLANEEWNDPFDLLSKKGTRREEPRAEIKEETNTNIKRRVDR